MTEQPAEALEPSEDAPVADPEVTEPESVDEAATDDAVGDTPEPKPQTRFDKRIGQLTGEKHALKEDRDYWRDKALAQPEPAKVEEPKVQAPQRPKFADFDHDMEAYADALSDFTEKSVAHAKTEAVTEITKTAENATATRTKESLQAEQRTRFDEKALKFSEEHPDYYEIVGNKTLNITSNMTDIMFELENGPAVAYHLGMHPEIAHRIAQKSPYAVAIELGKIENSLGQTPSVPTPSNAPDPENPISGGRGKLDRQIDDPKLTDKQFRDLRRKQISAR